MPGLPWAKTRLSWHWLLCKVGQKNPGILLIDFCQDSHFFALHTLSVGPVVGLIFRYLPVLQNRQLPLLLLVRRTWFLIWNPWSQKLERVYKTLYSMVVVYSIGRLVLGRLTLLGCHEQIPGVILVHSTPPPPYLAVGEVDQLFPEDIWLLYPVASSFCQDGLSANLLARHLILCSSQFSFWEKIAQAL